MYDVRGFQALEAVSAALGPYKDALQLARDPYIWVTVTNLHVKFTFTSEKSISM